MSEKYSSMNSQDSNIPSLAHISRCPVLNDKATVDAILDEDREKELKDQASNEKKSLFQRLTKKDWAMIVFIVLIVGFLCWMTYYESKHLKEFINWISDQVNHFVNNLTVTSFLVFLAFELAFHLFFVPGLTFFNVLLGFYMQNTLAAFLIVYSTSMIGCALTYYIAKFLFKDYFERTIFKKDIFNHMLTLSQESPWKASSVTR